MVPGAGFAYLQHSRAFWVFPAGERFMSWKKFQKTPSSCFLITNAHVLSVVVVVKSFKCGFKDNVAVKH